jgi:hypothetical protein
MNYFQPHAAKHNYLSSHVHTIVWYHYLNEHIRMSLVGRYIVCPHCVFRVVFTYNVTPQLCTHNPTHTTKIPICVHTQCKPQVVYAIVRLNQN